MINLRRFKKNPNYEDSAKDMSGKIYFARLMAE